MRAAETWDERSPNTAVGLCHRVTDHLKENFLKIQMSYHKRTIIGSKDTWKKKHVKDFMFLKAAIFSKKQLEYNINLPWEKVRSNCIPSSITLKKQLHAAHVCRYFYLLLSDFDSKGIKSKPIRIGLWPFSWCMAYGVLYGAWCIIAFMLFFFFTENDCF